MFVQPKKMLNHDYAMKGEITFIKGRLKFGDAINSAPFPSAVVVFGKKK